jgi:hypothetical protein
VVGFIGVIGGIAPVVLMTVGLVANGVANLIKFFAMLRSGVAKLNGQNNVLGGGFDYLTQAETENLAQTHALHLSHKDLISTFNVEKTSVDALAAAYLNAASQARALEPNTVAEIPPLNLRKHSAGGPLRVFIGNQIKSVKLVGETTIFFGLVDSVSATICSRILEGIKCGDHETLSRRLPSLKILSKFQSLVKHASGADTISANWKVKVDGQKLTKELKLYVCFE